MNRQLSALSGFLTTPGGIAVLAVVAAVLLLFIIELNYRLFMKNILDFLVSLVCVIVLSPVFIITAGVVKYRQREAGGKVFEQTACIGKGGRIIYVRAFSDLHCILKNLPRLLDVLNGKLSIVGPKLMDVGDAALIDDESMERFSARPGLISSVVLQGCKTYGEMFEKDVVYVKKRELFKDIGIFFRYVYGKIRGEDNSYLGETAEKSYAEVLLESGVITAADVETARMYANEAEHRSNPFSGR